MIKRTRPVWMEINLDNLAHNCREIKKVINPNALVMAVIKADGEGHGAVQIGQTLLDNGIDRFAVALLSEAIQLRKRYKNVPILILGYTPEYCAEEVINNDITQTIYSYEQAKFFSKKAQEIGKEVKLHIKLDTGMSRIGMQSNQKTVKEIQKIHKLPHILIEGIFTHFAVADTDKEFTYKQVKRFNFVCDELEKIGVKIPIKHVSNSAAIMDYPELNYNMVRPGRVLYGYYLPHEVANNNIELKKVMSMKAEICDVREIEAGEGVSYGLEYRANKKTKIATLPLGYGDGFTGLGKVDVIVNGNKIPVNIRITMDMTMIDVTGLDVQIGDEVIIFGSDGKESVLLEENTPNIGIVSIGILFWSGMRVPKTYIENGKIIQTYDYLLQL